MATDDPFDTRLPSDHRTMFELLVRTYNLPADLQKSIRLLLNATFASGVLIGGQEISDIVDRAMEKEARSFAERFNTDKAQDARANDPMPRKFGPTGMN